jgi:hypothetical protein
MKEALGSSETSVLTRSTLRNISEDGILLCKKQLSKDLLALAVGHPYHAIDIDWSFASVPRPSHGFLAALRSHQQSPHGLLMNLPAVDVCVAVQSV